MRGVPGSGKSTYIAEHFSKAVICSADHYFTDDTGNYNFDRRKLGAAHRKCQTSFKEAMNRRESLVVVDNTNTTIKEMSFYVKTAKHHGYRIECVRLVVPIEVAHERNVHGVPYGAVKAMIERMDDVPPDWHEKVVDYDGE